MSPLQSDKLKPIIRVCLVSLAVGLMGCGQAVDAAPDAANPTKSTPAKASPASDKLVPERVGNYLVNPRESHIRFSALQEGERFEGEFQSFNAYINFFPDNLDNSEVRVTIPLSSVEAGSRDRNSTLPGKVWFAQKAFPNAEFVATDFKTTDDGYLANGTLTIKGMSRPLSLPFTLDMSGPVVMRSTLSLDRTDWSIGEAPWDTDEWVSRAVELDIQVTAQSPY